MESKQADLKRISGGFTVEERLEQETTSPHGGYSHSAPAEPAGQEHHHCYSGEPDVQRELAQETTGPYGGFGSPKKSG